MATVLSTKAKFYQYSSREKNDVDHRIEHIESEGDRFIKELSHKQLNTNVTLQQQLETRQDFESSHTYRPITELTSGHVSYEEFKTLSTDESENLARCRDDSDQTPTKNISRHVRELALSVKPNSLETKLLEFAISCNAVGNVETDNKPKDHPINQLEDIHDRLFGHLNCTHDPQKTAKTILRKRRQLLETVTDPIEVKKKPKHVRRHSLWDVDNENIDKRTGQSRSVVYTCKKQKLFTICDGKIVELSEQGNNESSVVDESNINNDSKDNSKIENSSQNTMTSRFSLEEIRQLPKFENYDKGAISEVLYLKNLSPRVCQDDLVSIFAKYQEESNPRIVYNLMQHGRMRGQAFIRFHCAQTANRVLEEVNGTVLRGKPIIIQFGSAANDTNKI